MREPVIPGTRAVEDEDKLRGESLGLGRAHATIKPPLLDCKRIQGMRVQN